MTKRLFTLLVVAIHVRKNQQLRINALPLPLSPASIFDSRKFGHALAKFAKVLLSCSALRAKPLPIQVIHDFCMEKLELDQSIFTEALNNKVNTMPLDITLRLGITTKKGTDE